MYLINPVSCVKLIDNNSKQNKEQGRHNKKDTKQETTFAEILKREQNKRV